MILEQSCFKFYKYIYLGYCILTCIYVCCFKTKLLVFFTLLSISCLKKRIIPETTEKLSSTNTVQRGASLWADFQYVNVLSWKNVEGMIPRLRYRKKEEFPGLVKIRRKTQGTHPGKRGQSVTLVCACTHTQKCRHMRVRSPPCLASALVGWVSWCNIPSREQALERSDMTFLHSTDCMQHSFKKKKIICLLAWSVTKIIFTSVTLTVSGQEAERLCRLHCLPAPLGRLPENRAAVPEERVRSPGLRLALLALPLVTAEEVNGTHRGLGLHSPTPVLLTYTAKTPGSSMWGKNINFFL